jgi:hypothetical protein
MATRKSSAATARPKVAGPAAGRKPAAKKTVRTAPARATGAVLSELKSLAKELNKAAKGLSKKRSGNPKDVSTILGNVERMTAEAATRSLIEAESAKAIVGRLTESLGRDWSQTGLPPKPRLTCNNTPRIRFIGNPGMRNRWLWPAIKTGRSCCP